MTRPSMAMTAPTYPLVQVPRLATTFASSINIRSRLTLEDIRYILLVDVERSDPVNVTTNFRIDSFGDIALKPM
jgi:hypothetical protein